ncbi:proton-gated ion channel subunit pbo-6 [Bicyclus anynana]|uniref:Proton-gated ion channel subunit pbo-6 n=1 Tax=Bicyclus anynana TaxID=110368 RepID=A0A6J1MND0_BICAN|nr:proton-gated ion channel subunit pbo-6 [Bicyclus anynana]
MRTLQIYCVIWIVMGLVSAQMEHFNFTYAMASLCKEHVCKHGYSYEVFYEVNAEDRKVVRSDPSVVYEMHIAIMAASNGHILLSTVPKPDTSDPVYEIVVGGGGNRFTELRANLKRNAKASAKTLQILSSVDFRAFYIKITEDGLIEFGIEGDALPILSYQDMNPITVRYFSFAAWSGVEAKFLYDCPIPSANGKEGTIPVTPDSKAVEPKLSNSEKLQRTLLLGKDPGMPPGPDVNVDLGVRVVSVTYDAYTSKLTTGLSIIRKWTDDSLAWNPNKFNGIDRLTFRQGQIWSPQLTVFNTDSQNMLDDRNPELISMDNSGTAILHMRTTTDTWCFDYENTVTKWPRDKYICAIVIELWEVHEIVTLNVLHPSTSYELEIIDGIEEDIQNAWEVSTTQAIVDVLSWKKNYASNDNFTHQSDRLVITVNLQRRATVYNIVFYTPLLVLVTFVLLSFWSEPLSMKRVWFYAGCSVVICMGLCYIDVLVPCHTIPSILILYVVILFGVLLAMLIQLVLKTSVTKTLCKTTLIQTMLTSHYFRSLFCLAPLKVCHIYESVNDGYDSEVVEPPRNGNVEEMEREKDDYNECNDLAEAIDKSMFVIYSLTFAIMLAMHF